MSEADKPLAVNLRRLAFDVLPDAVEIRKGISAGERSTVVEMLEHKHAKEDRTGNWGGKWHWKSR